MDQVIERTDARIADGLVRDLMGDARMHDIQISIGEIIEAVYEELIETYNDRELALVAAQAVGDELLARMTTPKPRVTPAG